MLQTIPPSDCIEAREAASARADGELSSFDAARLDAHLRGCVDCRAFAGSLAGLTALLGGADLEQPAARLFIQRRGRPVLRLNAAAAAVTIALAAASSFAVGHFVGSERGDRSATVGSTISAGPQQPSPVLGMLRRARPGRIFGSQVIPV
jgi:predicted anti-sigma-YlaC factor YlaD